MGCREQPPRGAPWVSGLVGHFVQTWPDSECSHTVQFSDCRTIKNKIFLLVISSSGLACCWCAVKLWSNQLIDGIHHSPLTTEDYLFVSLAPSMVHKPTVIGTLISIMGVGVGVLQVYGFGSRLNGTKGVLWSILNSSLIPSLFGTWRVMNPSAATTALRHQSPIEHIYWGRREQMRTQRRFI